MSWCRDNDGKIITDEEFQDECFECSCFCSEGTINVPCNGERTDCPYYKEVDTSEYDTEIRNKAIEEFAERLKEKAAEILKNPDIMADYKKCTIWKVRDIDEIAEQLKR